MAEAAGWREQYPDANIGALPGLCGNGAVVKRIGRVGGKRAARSPFDWGNFANKLHAIGCTSCHAAH
jgi:hypothetical protein